MLYVHTVYTRKYIIIIIVFTIVIIISPTEVKPIHYIHYILYTRVYYNNNNIQVRSTRVFHVHRDYTTRLLPVLY